MSPRDGVILIRRKNTVSGDKFSGKQVRFMNTFRELWEQHVMWTRSLIISTASNLPDLQYISNRLLRNPSDFANVLRLFYGNKKANEFKELFLNHLLIAAKLVNDAKVGNMEAVAQDRKKWYENADEIATYLSEINPKWNKQEWQKMLYEHLKMTEDEVTLRLKGQYSEDIAIYDLIEAQALNMADVMSQGIIHQFRI